MIRIKSLTHTFNRGTSASVQALQDVSLEIERGEYVVLLGSNGSGKSTLLNIIAGSVLPDSGSVILDDTDVTTLPEFKRSKWIARIFQDPMAGTAAELSIADNFRLAALRSGSKSLRIGVTTTFKKDVKDRLKTLGLGLEDQLMKPVGSLSGGQRQAITLLMAAMDKSGILLMDEPTAALDPRTAKQVMELAGKLISDKQLTAILVTHNLRDALQYGTRIVQMTEGRIIRDINKNRDGNPTPEALFSWF
jgi:putative ABC transport system ATP-binding protein